MTTIELLMPFLFLALVLGTCAVVVLCVRMERRLADRKRIGLGNYRQKNHLFYISKDIPIFVIACVLLVGDLALGIVALTDPVVFTYIYAAGVLLAAEAVVVWLSWSRGKCARDIHLFDAYHVRVQDLLMSKTRLESDIGVCRRRVDELRSKLDATLGDFNRNLSRGIPKDYLERLFVPLEEMLSGYLADIERFSTEIETAFNAALQEFLLHEVEPELNILPLRSFDETAVDDLLVSIKTTFGTGITALVVEEAGQGAVRNAAALGNIMNLLHELDVRIEEDVLVRFIEVASRFPDREKLAGLLHANRQIPATLLRERLLPSGTDWVFVEGMGKAYHVRDLAEILGDLLTADRPELCRKLLADLPDTGMPALDTALEAFIAKGGDAENAACRTVRAYRLVLDNHYAAGNSGSLYENIAIMLFDRRTELCFDEEEQVRIAKIVRDGAFLQGGRELAGFYLRATESMAPLAASTTRVLLSFLGSAAGEQWLLRADLLARLLGEYKFTLSRNDMETLRSLLAALTLLMDREGTAADEVLTELSALPPSAPSLPEYVCGDRANVLTAAKQVGRLLLAHLTQNDRVRLRSAIYRTEAERCTLDRILKL